MSITPIIAAAALARIDERGGLMATKQIPEHKAAERAMWALGDYHAFAKATVWEVGPKLVAACGIGPGQRVLDVAAGTGNVAIRAAEAGAQVVASDLTPENFASGRREAEDRGVELQWVEADAEALPFARRRVRRRHLVVRRDLRPGSPGRRGRAAPRLPARRHDRNGQLHARRPGEGVLRDPRAVTCRRQRPERSRRSSGATRSTCAGSSATASHRSR